MTNSIVGHPTPSPQRVDSRTPASRESDTVGDAKAWHSAFEQAQGGAFQGWFQAPGMQQPNGHATLAVARTIAAAPAHAAAPARSTSQSSDRAVASHAQAGSASHPARAHDAEPASRRDDGAASVALSPLTGIAPVFEAPAARDQVLASTLAALTGLPVALASGAVGELETPPPVALQVGTAASPFAAGTSDESIDDTPSTELASRPRPDAASDTREPLRVHAQWSDDGVRLWLGADAGGLADVQAVTAQLQQALAAQGTRLLRVVCNGHDLAFSAGNASPGAARFDARGELASAAAADRIPPLNF